jgi:hypothetical protein
MKSKVKGKRHPKKKSQLSLSCRVLVRGEFVLMKDDDEQEPIKLAISPCDSDSGYWRNKVQDSV